MNRLKLCACALLPLELIVFLALTIGLVLMHALARMLAPAKTPVFVLTVTHRKFGLSDIWMKDLPVLNPWSRILVCPSPDYQTGDEGLLDACGAFVRVSIKSHYCRQMLNRTAILLPLLHSQWWRPYLTTIMYLLATLRDNTPTYLPR
jgi:hypothetical protein